MKLKLLLVLLVVSFRVAAQQINLKSFVWNLYSDTVSATDVDPSDVYLALFSKGIIDKPFFGDNEKKLQWVSKKEWTFETEFPLSAKTLEKDRVEMVFEGLDTYANVYLNGQLVLKADNMFRKWVVDIKRVAKRENRLKIVFKSPFKIIREARNKGEWKLPYDYGFVRKAPYHFGWDWGPVFVTCGIWKAAYLKAWNNARLNDFFVKQNRVTPLLAQLKLSLSLEAAQPDAVVVQVYRDSVLLREDSVAVHEGTNQYLMEDVIVAPRLWWPNGMGEPHLYNYKAIVRAEGKNLDSMTIATGLRNVELVQQPDSIGRSFYFKVNGVPLFAKGANYIPPDNFLPRVSEVKYRQIIRDAKDDNMNMLRVWGGGTYEDDDFYRLCDENGILVWQDFMFAGDMIPGDTAFLNNVRQEAVDNVVRLRNHPCIALWCGNNEIDEAWHNWGWQKQFKYSKEDSAKLWHVYQHLFEEILPDVVKKYDPETFYWPSSPSIGWGNAGAYKQGDVHYWEVWWGKAPFSFYEHKIGRFMSEYGFQGMPDMKTIDEFTLPKDRFMGSEALDVHQKHPFGWEAIREYMERNFPVPDNLEDYDYVSQLLQAKGIGMAIEAHRRAKPYCMGTLYWQLNDCWPVVSWSSVDYYGRWKALHYKVKNDYKRELISFDKKADNLRIWAVTDDVKTKTCYLRWDLIDFYGNSLVSGIKALVLKPNSSKVYKTIDLHQLKTVDTNAVVLSVVLLSEDSTELAFNNYFFAKPKYLKLPKPDVAVNSKKIETGYTIYLQSNCLAKGVYLSTQVKGSFSDNYFDLLPGKQKQLFIKTNEVLKPGDIKIKTFYDVKNSD